VALQSVLPVLIFFNLSYRGDHVDAGSVFLIETLMGRAIFCCRWKCHVSWTTRVTTEKVRIFALRLWSGSLAGLLEYPKPQLSYGPILFWLCWTEIGDLLLAVVLVEHGINCAPVLFLETVLGVLLLTVVNNVLVLVGIPSTLANVLLLVAFISFLAAAFFRSTRRAKFRSLYWS